MQIESLKYQYDVKNPEPKYRQLTRAFEAWLEAEQPGPGTKLPSDRRLSEHLQIANLTICRSLNELADRGVLERRVGAGTFVASGNLKSLAGKTCRIGLVCHEPIMEEGGYISRLLYELRKSEKHNHFDLVQLIRSPEQYRQVIFDYKLSGMIVISAEKHFLPELKKLADSGFPVVSLGSYRSEIAGISFGTDHVKVAADAVAYLNRCGHRKIGILVARPHMAENPHSSVLERLEGYRKGMWSCRQPVNPDWEVEAFHADYAFLRDRFGRLRETGDFPTAFLIPNMPFSPLVYRALNEMGLRIPQDVSLISFDDALICEQLNPPLTVFKQNLEYIVAGVMEYLGQMISGKIVTPHGMANAVLVERGSCLKIEN